MMASPNSYVMCFLFIISRLLALAMASSLSTITCPTHYTCESEMDMVLYIHHILGGQNNNSQVVVEPKRANLFGAFVVTAWNIVDAPTLNANGFGRAKGSCINSDIEAGAEWSCSLNIVFNKGRFNGSTLQVLGPFFPAGVGEWAIVGGTGEFTLARGNVKYRFLPNPVDIYQEIKIHALYTPPAGSTATISYP